MAVRSVDAVAPFTDDRASGSNNRRNKRSRVKEKLPVDALMEVKADAWPVLAGALTRRRKIELSHLEIDSAETVLQESSLTVVDSPNPIEQNPDQLSVARPPSRRRQSAFQHDGVDDAPSRAQISKLLATLTELAEKYDPKPPVMTDEARAVLVEALGCVDGRELGSDSRLVTNIVNGLLTRQQLRIAGPKGEQCLLAATRTRHGTATIRLSCTGKGGVGSLRGRDTIVLVPFVDNRRRLADEPAK